MGGRMADVKLRPLVNDPSRLVVERSDGRARGIDSAPAILELEALRHSSDLAAPEQAAPYFGPLVKLYRGDAASGDHLRVPAPSNLDAPTTRAALSRLMDTGALRAEGSGPKEARMLRVLGALSQSFSHIERQAGLRLEEGR